MPDQNPTSNITGITIDPNSVQPLQSAPPEDLSHVTIDPSSVTALQTAPTEPTAATQESPTPAFSLSKMLGPQTAIGSQPTESEQQEMSGVSDILHGNFSQGVGKIYHAEAPHVIPGSPIEKLIQKFKPDFKGAATPEYQQQNEPAINKPLIDTAQFINKTEHPVQKALAEIFQSMSSPSAIATVVASGGLGMVENPTGIAMMNRLVNAGFAAPSLVTLYQKSKSFADSYNKGDFQDAAYQMTHALASGLISALTVTGAAGGTDAVAAKTTELAGKAVSAGKAAITPVKTLADHIAKVNEEFQVPLSRAQSGGGKVNQLVEAGLRKIPLVNKPFAELASNQAKALSDAADKIINPETTPEAGENPTTLSPSERGQRIKDSLDEAKSLAGENYEKAMDKLAQTGAENFKLDTTPLKQTAETLIESLQPAEGFESLVTPGRTKALNLLHDIAENDQPLSVGDAIKLRRQISEEVANPQGDLKPYKAVLLKMRTALNDELGETLSTLGREPGQGEPTDPDAVFDQRGTVTPESAAALNEFSQASARYRVMKEAIANRVIKSLTRSDPQAVGPILLGRISPEVAEYLQKLSPKTLVPVGDSLLQTMFDKVKSKNADVLTGQGVADIWNGLDEKVKETVFGPELPKIQRFVDLITKIDLQKPKSGWTGSKIAGATATGTGLGVEIGTALASHAIPPFTATAAGLGLTGYQISRLLTGRGGQSFLDDVQERADATTPEEILAATEKLQKMGQSVKP
jgi:hypothetical protein